MPILVIAKAKTVWMNFLAQSLLLSENLYPFGIWNLESGILNLNPRRLLFVLLSLLLPLQGASQFRSSFRRRLLGATLFRRRLLRVSFAHFRRCRLSFLPALLSRR